MGFIHIAAPDIGKAEKQAVQDVLDSGLIAQGPRVEQLEKEFAKYCGTKFAIAVNSGTAALHAALFGAGIKEGDEVITTPFSFIATINPIMMLGAKPVLVDIDPGTFNIDTKLVRQAVTQKTKAILPVHLYGQPVDWNELEDIAKEHNLKLIEDACQAVGANYGTKKAGNLGDLGCFSLYATKNIMSGEGGIITTNNEEYDTIIRRYRQHGMSAPYKYEHIGYNYRMTDLQAAIAEEQLKKADKFNKARQENANKLNEQLEGIKGLILPHIANNRTHVFHQYTIRLTDNYPISRDDFVSSLREKGIGAGVYYPLPLHFIKHIAKATGHGEGDFPETVKAAKEVVSLPVHPQVTPENLNHIVESIKELSSES